MTSVRFANSYRVIPHLSKYLSNVNFSNVDITNIDIADTISFYTHEQKSFDEAIAIRKEYQKLKGLGQVTDNILNVIDEERENILICTSSCLTNLNEVSNNGFSCEFLSKADPKNFILGKYCSCCAHIEGVGSGIMKASILHPDCQNLVIKDKIGRIIAKSTLYINRKQGYGVFNNVEINNKIKGKQDELIYQKYIEFINEFVKQYNKQNPSLPIKQINVGMGLNDLEGEIIKHNIKSDKILEGLNFSDFGGHPGDWQDEQYVIWKKDSKKR